mgnify:CR=1 FL=1
MPDSHKHYSAHLGFGKLRKIHFIGIGGAGMSGIAEVLINLGYQVSGSDIKDGKATQHLKSLMETSQYLSLFLSLPVQGIHRSHK